jgi:hypothetical protein
LRTWSILKEERPLRRLQHPISPNQDGSHPMHRATKESWLTDSDALIVKAYAISAPTMRFVVPIGDGSTVTEENRMR